MYVCVWLLAIRCICHCLDAAHLLQRYNVTVQRPLLEMLLRKYNIRYSIPSDKHSRTHRFDFIAVKVVEVNGDLLLQRQ